MKELHYKPARFLPFRIVLSLICAALMILVIAIAINGETIDYAPADVNTIEAFAEGRKVEGTFYSIVGKYDGGLDVTGERRLNCYVIITGNSNLMLIEAEKGTYTDTELNELYEGGRMSVTLNGYLSKMPDTEWNKLRDYVKTNNIREKNYVVGIPISTKVTVITMDASARFKVVMGTIALCAMLATIIYFMMRKPIKNLYFIHEVKRGRAKLDRGISQNDIILESEGTYKTDKDQKDYFYVNTENDVRERNSEQKGGAVEISDIDGKPVRSERPMKFTDEIDFYDSGVNSDGNFYVSAEDNKTDTYEDDEEGNGKKLLY